MVRNGVSPMDGRACFEEGGSGPPKLMGMQVTNSCGSHHKTSQSTCANDVKKQRSLPNQGYPCGSLPNQQFGGALTLSRAWGSLEGISVLWYHCSHYICWCRKGTVNDDRSCLQTLSQFQRPHRETQHKVCSCS